MQSSAATSTTAAQVADYLVWLAAHECEDDPDFLTPLKLQKLLYYAQGWAFSEWGHALFPERIEAWRDGPVVPEVYARFKGREKLPITPAPDAAPPQLDAETRAHVHSVWDAYKGYSGWALRDLTHAEPPWLETYAPEDPHNRCSRTIPLDLLERHFRGRAAQAATRLAAKRDRLRAVAKANTRALTGRDVF
jgi:uncharacterized phage-associated protein